MQAQEDLEAIADVIRADTDLREAVLVCPAQELLGLLTEGSTAPTVREAVAEYLSAYGHQIYTLDFAEPTQGESPSAVGLELKRLVAGDDSGRSQARRAEVAGRRARLAKETMASLGPLRGWCFRKLLARAEQFAPYREDALFYMGAGWPALRRIALALGHRLVAAGTLQSADDVFFLTCEELLRASSATRNRGVTSGIRSLARERRMLRESRRTLHPPARVPEDLRFKFGPFDFTAMFEVWETQKRNDRDSDVLLGFAVSRGSVTGLASVVRSHEEFGQMQPGTILVCPTTTPAWTPLLAHALGLVTDIGAPLAHGSIIAREYGIPAVLGTGNATQRIRTGQRITVNGDTGQVVLQ
jgi:pyruvate,water dikinase